MPGAGASVFGGDGGTAGGAAAATAGAAVIATGRPPSTFRATRRETPFLTSGVSLMAPPLEVPLLDLVRDVVRRAPGDGHDAERRVLVGVGGEAAAVGHEQVLHVPRLAELVQDGSLRVVAHGGGPDLVDDLAALLDPPVFQGKLGTPDLSAHRLDELPEGLLHVPGLEDLGFGPLPMEPQDGDPPLVHHVGVDLAVAVVVGDHLAAAREADEGAVHLAVLLLEVRSIAAAHDAVGAGEDAGAGHSAPAPHLDVIPAWERHLLLVVPPRHVEVHPADAVLVVGGPFHEGREEPPHADAHGVHQIFAHEAARVREAVREAARP